MDNSFVVSLTHAVFGLRPRRSKMIRLFLPEQICSIDSPSSGYPSFRGEPKMVKISGHLSIRGVVSSELKVFDNRPYTSLWVSHELIVPIHPLVDMEPS